MDETAYNDCGVRRALIDGHPNEVGIQWVVLELQYPQVLAQTNTSLRFLSRALKYKQYELFQTIFD